MEQSKHLLCLQSLMLFYLLSTTTLLFKCEGRSLRQSRRSSHGLKHHNTRSAKHTALKYLDLDSYYSSSDPYLNGSPFSLPPYDVVMGPTSSPQDINPPFCVYPPLTPLPPSTTLPSPTIWPSPTSYIPPVLVPPVPGFTPPAPEFGVPGTPEFGMPGTPYFNVPGTPEYTPSPPEFSGLSPPSVIPGPPEYGPSPPSIVPNPPEFGPGPPIILPNPPEYGPSPPSFEPSPPGSVPVPSSSPPPPPPDLGFNPSPVPGSSFSPSPPPPVLGFNPSPPENVPGPPEFMPGTPTFLPPIVYPPPTSLFTPPPPALGFNPRPQGPPGFTPGPPIFLPPIVYPPPAVPPPASVSPGRGLWCVANPNVPDPIIQEAMNYACGSGADCDSIQPNGPCYLPDTILAHASFAFNSYWQMRKASGGTCDFGGTGILVTKDPSYDGCHFME